MTTAGCARRRDYATLRFSLRADAPEPGLYTYTSLTPDSAGIDGTVHSQNVPDVGDLVYLNSCGAYRVLERAWTWPARGSAAWGTNTWDWSDTGPTVQIIVEEADGLFRDEYTPAEEQDTQ